MRRAVKVSPAVKRLRTLNQLLSCSLCFSFVHLLTADFIIISKYFTYEHAHVNTEHYTYHHHAVANAIPVYVRTNGAEMS